MATLPGIRRLLRLRVSPRALEREVDDEIRAHLEMRVEHLVARGWSAAAARAEAERRFGNVAEGRRRILTSARSTEHRMRFRDWLDTVRQDARLALRQMRRAPGFALFGALTFALGIGLTSVVFTVVDGVLLKPLPFPRPERLVALSVLDSMRSPVPVVSADDWYDWRNEN